MRTSIALNSIAFALSAAALPLNATFNAPNITIPDGMYLADNQAILPIIARRQDIDFDLVDEAPEPMVAIDDSSNYNQQAAIDAVISEVEANPLPQRRDTDLHRRDIVVETSSGYTPNVQIQDAAISAPKNCQGSVCQTAYTLDLTMADGPAGHFPWLKALHYWSFRHYPLRCCLHVSDP